MSWQPDCVGQKWDTLGKRFKVIHHVCSMYTVCVLCYHIIYLQHAKVENVWSFSHSFSLLVPHAWSRKTVAARILHVRLTQFEWEQNGLNVISCRYTSNKKHYIGSIVWYDDNWKWDPFSEVLHFERFMVCRSRLLRKRRLVVELCQTFCPSAVPHLAHPFWSSHLQQPTSLNSVRCGPNRVRLVILQFAIAWPVFPARSGFLLFEICLSSLGSTRSKPRRFFCFSPFFIASGLLQAWSCFSIQNDCIW